MEEAQKIVDNALNACKASDALEALNIGIPKRNLRNSPRLTIELQRICLLNQGKDI